jgi:hypothetical protein
LQLWCYDEVDSCDDFNRPLNVDFDFDNYTLIFIPILGGYRVLSLLHFANNDAYTTNEGTSISVIASGNDAYINDDIDPNSTFAISSASNGSLVNDGNGQVTCTPGPIYFGSDSFGYSICVIDGYCDTTNTLITVTPINDPPFAEDDVASTFENTTVTILAFINDMDIDGIIVPQPVLMSLALKMVSCLLMEEASEWMVFEPAF